MMCSFYLIAQLFDTMYHIRTISDILRQGVDYLAQWLEHLGRGIFSNAASFLSYEFSYS